MSLFFRCSLLENTFLMSNGRFWSNSGPATILTWFQHICIRVTIVSKKAAHVNRSAKFEIGNRFYVTISSFSPEICQWCLRMKNWKAKGTAENQANIKLKRIDQNTSRDKQNWKIGCSRIIVFTETGKLSYANYRAAQQIHIEGIRPLWLK